MATPKTVSKGAGIDLRKFAPPDMARRDDGLILALGVNDDLNGGCAASATITGPTRTRAAGDVIIAGWASAPGTVTIETSSDAGTTWPNSDSEAVPAGEYVVSRVVTVGGANRYRIKFTAGNQAASVVKFSTQARA